MFKLESLRFHHNTDNQEYKFSYHTFIYGMNTVGKTALTKAIDYVLGSSENLTYQGLDNIDSIEAHLTNDLTTLWIKRTVFGEFFYRRTEDSAYSEISADTYKDNICLMLTPNPNNRFAQVYSKVFDENPTFRSFNFLNYLEEKGLGDLSVVFTKARELKHQIRISNIMDFFFNYDNIEQIYEKEVLLEQRQKELDELNKDYQEYSRSVSQIEKLFVELHLKYTGDYEKDYSTFTKFRTSYTRTAKTKSKDLVYLSKASFSLAEEIKLYSFMQSQSTNMMERNERIKRLLAILNSIVEGNPNNEQYINFITKKVEEIQEENVLLSLTDYQKAIRGIQVEKEKIDQQIRILKGQASEIQYEEAIKKIGLIEHTFSILNRNVDSNRLGSLRGETSRLRQEIKELKSAFDKKEINAFNDRLTDLYLKSGLKVKHLMEDCQNTDFSLEFDPFRLCLFASHRTEEGVERFIPGSMARQTHLQVLIYLCMFDYLKKHFQDFIYMPFLIIDSANQPMGIEIFREVYPIIVKLAEEIGIQTIFLSKDLLDEIPDEDFIDISSGLNKFHKQS
ncbi:MAG: AAA family ATPase [Syntrophomonas sp.]